MKVFFKSRAAFRTIAAADVLSASICIDSSDGQASTVTVVGEYARSYTDQWAIYDGQLFLIGKTTPQDGRTLFTLSEPIEAFSRPLLYSAPAVGAKNGDYLAELIRAEYIAQPDPVYALPYLSVSSSDTSAFIPPAADDNGLFSLTAYIRTLRQLAGLRLNWTISGDSLLLQLSRGAPAARRIVFDDGHAQLSTAVYSRSGLAKLTVIQAQEDGSKLTADYYLAEDGSVSTAIPGRRAEGQWDTITIAANQDPQLKAEETFAKNKASHKVEFFSDRDYQVFDPCDISLYGEILSSYISYKGRSSTDGRYLYKSGELAVTATEILRGGMR